MTKEGKTETGTNTFLYIFDSIQYHNNLQTGGLICLIEVHIITYCLQIGGRLEAQQKQLLSGETSSVFTESYFSKS